MVKSPAKTKTSAKKKVEKKPAKGATKKPKREKKLAKPTSEEQNEVFKHVFANPKDSIAQISKKLNISYSRLQRMLGSDAGKALQDEINNELLVAIGRIRHKSLIRFEKLIDDPKIKNEILLSALKFALQKVVVEEREPEPEALVFETVISETGMVEQTTRKLYSKTTFKKGVPEGE